MKFDTAKVLYNPVKEIEQKEKKTRACFGERI